MLVKREVFNQVKRPWFEAEYEYGTDIQICRKAREKGFTVWCDTSIEIGHQILEKEVILPSRVKAVLSDVSPEGLKKDLELCDYLDNYSNDVLAYTKKSLKELEELADLYDDKEIKGFEGNLEEYYITRGVQQLARNFFFNSTTGRVDEAMQILKTLSSERNSYGLDYCCGSAPIGFEFALRGKKMDFIDLAGAASYEFVKWRAEKRNVEAGFKLKGPYDFVLLMDAIEHLEDWEFHLEKICSAMKVGATLVTNFFTLMDYHNAEHINMNKYEIEKFITDRKILPVNPGIWVKEGS